MVDNISGWWYTNPPEKYESQIGSSSQLLGKKIFQITNQQMIRLSLIQCVLSVPETLSPKKQT